MKQRIVLVAITVLVAGGIGILVGRAGQPAAAEASSDVASTPPEDGRTAPRTPASATTGRAVVATSAPLPPLDAPLAQIHGELRRRAAAGEAGAACRLAAEHERCEMERQHLRAVVSQVEHLDSATRRDRDRIPSEALQHRARMRTQVETQVREKTASVAQCDAAPPLSPEARARYWRQAALAGHVPAMRHYASGNGFRWHDLMDALPALQTYRREAEGIARRAALEGDAASAYALAMAYIDGGGHWRSFLAQSVTPDLTQALAWFSVLSRHPAITRLPPEHPTARSVSQHLATLQAAASPSESAQADALARTAGIPAASSDEPTEMLLRPDGGIGDIAPIACGQTRATAGEPARART
ncbi:MAG: hypothetical protein ABW163_02430 [Luteimonas sp.]